MASGADNKNWSMREFRLDGKWALITGATRGIGLGIAASFAQAGANIVIVARDRGRLDAARMKLAEHGNEMRTYAFDLSNIDGIDGIYAEIIADVNGIDILVNNAGTTRRGAAETISFSDWDYVLNVNLKSVFAISRAFAQERIKTGKSGKIINIASLMGEAVRENNAPYAASKGGIRQLTKALAVDWAKHGINVNAIAPGYIRTDLTRQLWEDAAFDKWLKERTPLGRWGRPEDLGHCAVFLAATASDFITGQTLYVDGGLLSKF